MSRHRSIEIDVANCFILSLEGSIDDSKVAKVEKKEAFVISMIISRTMAARFGSIFFTASFDYLRRGCAPLFCREPRTARDVSSSRSFPIFAKIRESEGNGSMENAG